MSWSHVFAFALGAVFGSGLLVGSISLVAWRYLTEGRL